MHERASRSINMKRMYRNLNINKSIQITRVFYIFYMYIFRLASMVYLHLWIYVYFWLFKHTNDKNRTNQSTIIQFIHSSWFSYIWLLLDFLTSTLYVTPLQSDDKNKSLWRLGPTLQYIQSFIYAIGEWPTWNSKICEFLCWWTLVIFLVWIFSISIFDQYDVVYLIYESFLFDFHSQLIQNGRIIVIIRILQKLYEKLKLLLSFFVTFRIFNWDWDLKEK